MGVLPEQAWQGLLRGCFHPLNPTGWDQAEPATRRRRVCGALCSGEKGLCSLFPAGHQDYLQAPDPTRGLAVVRT